MCVCVCVCVCVWVFGCVCVCMYVYMCVCVLFLLLCLVVNHSSTIIYIHRILLFNILKMWLVNNFKKRSIDSGIFRKLAFIMKDKISYLVYNFFFFFLLIFICRLQFFSLHSAWLWIIELKIVLCLIMQTCHKQPRAFFNRFFLVSDVNMIDFLKSVSAWKGTTNLLQNTGQKEILKAKLHTCM